jgi:hypothetical protein
MIVLPDLIPSFTISDPTTYVNLLNLWGILRRTLMLSSLSSYEPYIYGNLEEVFWEL